MSQVSSRELFLVAEMMYGLFQGIESRAQRRSGQVVLGQHDSQSRAQDPSVDPGVVQRDAQAQVRKPVAVRARQALDQAMQAQPAQLIRHLARRQVFGFKTPQRPQLGAQLGIGEAARQQSKQDDGVEQGLAAKVAKV